MNSPQTAAFSGLHRRTLPALSTQKRVAESGSISVPRAKARAAFQRAASHLGINAQIQILVLKLIEHTFPHDWIAPSRPVTWVSNAQIQEHLNVGRTRAKSILRAAEEFGLITNRPSPNGKRYGRRDANRQIAEAYGIDLSPIAARYDEFVAIAISGENAFRERRQLQRRATIAQREILAITQAAIEESLPGDWDAQIPQALNAREELRATTMLEQLRHGVLSLEDHATRLARLALEFSTVGSVNRPQDAGITTPLTTVTTHPFSNDRTAHADLPSGGDRQQHRTSTAAPEPELAQFLPPGITPSQLLQALPHLSGIVDAPRPDSWPEIAAAGPRLAGETGIDAGAWRKTVRCMGPTGAAIALAVVRRRAGVANPQRYLIALADRHEAGELRLDLTIAKLIRLARAQARDLNRPAGRPK
jgi:replication initiation protein RepC